MSPSEFAERCDPTYKPARFHHLIAAIAGHAIRQGGARLIFNLPPGHGKSRLFAIETPIWEMLRVPGSQVVVATYGLDLAKKHSREARARFEGECFDAVDGVRLRKSNEDYWDLTSGSSFKAVGVDGPLTGFRADLLILDDLHKDGQEARSETMRRRVWEWFQGTAFARQRSEKSNIILIGTRWHADDVTGRLMAMEGSKWQCVNLKAIAGECDELCRHPGDALWPDRISIEYLNETRQTIGSYFWAAQYDGNPIQDTGNHVDVTKFKVVLPDSVPTGIRCVRYWDLATSIKLANDFTAGAYCGEDREGNLWILGMARDRMEWPRVRETICQRAQIDRCQVGIESVGTQGGLVQNLREVFPPDFCLTETTPEKDKLTRALPWFTRVNSGRCYLVAGAWNAEFLAECQAFPLGAHDDQVDAVSGAAGILFGGAVGSPLIPELPRDRMQFARRERGVFL